MILRVFRWLAWGRRIAGRLPGRRRTVYVDQRVAEYRDLWSAAARAIGADFVDLESDKWEVRRGDRSTRISNDLVQFDDPVVLALAGDKSYCYRLARLAGVPTPDPVTYPLHQLDKVLARMPMGAGPYVVKPARDTGSGMGVTVGVTSRIGLASAMALASLYSDRIIVGRLVAAETVRLLFLDGVMIHAVRRTGVRIHGDGSSTIEALLGRVETGPVPVDRFVRWTLTQQGLSVDDVPVEGTAIVARWLPQGVDATRELRTIYNDDVTDLIDPTLVAEIQPLVATLGTRFAGVDLLTNDPGRSLVESGGAFIELNTTPGLHHHCQPSADGTACAIAVKVLEALLDDRVR